MVKIDPEFKKLIPWPLTDEEFAGLEGDILANGCRDPLVVWKGHDLLLDGHHRFKICQKHKLHYSVHKIDLPDRNAAKIWIYRTQMNRRNITMTQRLELAMAMESLLREEAKQRQAHGQTAPGKTLHQNSDEAFTGLPKPTNWTDQTLGREAGVSHDTVHKYRTIKNKAIEPIQKMIQDDELSISAGYKASRLPTEKQEELARGGVEAIKKEIKNKPKSKPKAKKEELSHEDDLSKPQVGYNNEVIRREFEESFESFRLSILNTKKINWETHSKQEVISRVNLLLDLINLT